MMNTRTDLGKMLQEIDALYTQIQSHRPLNEGEKMALQKILNLEFTYNSNAIEGNTLTLSETRILLEDGVTIGGKTVRELEEAINHKEIFPYLQNLITKNISIDEQIMLTLHRFVLQRIDNSNSGIYRSLQVIISGDPKEPTPVSDINKEIKELFEWHEENKTSLHPVLLASEFHYKLVKIHPFIDGNGRLSRLCFNLILMQHGYPMIIFPVIRRQEYISSLHSSSPTKAFACFCADITHENLKDYLRMLG